MSGKKRKLSRELEEWEKFTRHTVFWREVLDKNLEEKTPEELVQQLLILLEEALYAYERAMYVYSKLWERGFLMRLDEVVPDKALASHISNIYSLVRSEWEKEKAKAREKRED